MYTSEQSAELVTLVDQQFSRLGHQLSVPLEPRDSAFVTAALPEWLGFNMEYRLNILWQEATARSAGCFVLSMDIDFGSYHRRMELTSGSCADLYQFATKSPPSRQICESIFELMVMERAET